MYKSLTIYYFRVKHRQPPIRTTLSYEPKKRGLEPAVPGKKQNPSHHSENKSRFAIQKISSTDPSVASTNIQIPIALTI